MFSDTSVKKIMKKAGALRVSKKAVQKFKKVLYAYSIHIARKAVKNAEYSGRKSIQPEDIEETMRIDALR